MINMIHMKSMKLIKKEKIKWDPPTCSGVENESKYQKTKMVAGPGAHNKMRFVGEVLIFQRVFIMEGSLFKTPLLQIIID